MNELESQLSNLERDLSDVNTNYVALKKNHLELLELKNVLQNFWGIGEGGSIEPL